MLLAIVLGTAVLPSTALAQEFDAVGTRAAGMAGAFVAVTDDASAIYWNPGALASSAFFSLLVDRDTSKATVDQPSPLGGSRSATAILLSTPALGLGYYRLRASYVSPTLTGVGAAPSATASIATLITHHSGVTLVQSVTGPIAVGATLKLVRGVAASQIAPSGTVDDLLEQSGDLIGRATNRFDADVGVSAVTGAFRAGLTVRNLTSPDFRVGEGGEEMTLERQARAGVSLRSPAGWLIALDADLNKSRGSIGEVREVALGTEALVVPRAYARAGVRWNTVSDQPGGRAPTVAVGGSYSARSSLWIDGEATFGSAAGGRGWGVAARVAF
jgi:hypothetical protein